MEIPPGDHWNAMVLYYNLGDGVAWNVYERRVVFASPESARKFKSRYPQWAVLHKIK